MTVLPGIYRAPVVGSSDPQVRKRLLVTAPGLLGPGALWAEACMACRSRAVPAVGSSAWPQFEGGDPGLPVWVGVRAWPEGPMWFTRIRHGVFGH